MSTGSSPPAQPPMLSPDGKWVWDGHQWVPVAVHESVFPAYGPATAAAVEQVASPLAETMVAPPVNPFAGPPSASPFAGPPPGPSYPPVAAPAVVSPPIVPPVSYTAPGATPPWQAWANAGGGRSRTLYLAGAFIAVAIGVIVTIYFISAQLPFFKASNGATPTPTPAASPTPQLAARSDSAVAQRYVTSNLNSHLVLLQTAMTAENQACNGTNSLSCQQGLEAMEQTLPNALTAFDTPPPPCIARQVAKVQADLLALQAAVKAALKGYSDSNRNEVNAGIRQYNAAGRPFPTDLAAVTKAQATCDTQPGGP